MAAGQDGFLKEIMPKQSPRELRGASWMLGLVTDETSISENSLEGQDRMSKEYEGDLLDSLPQYGLDLSNNGYL